MALYFYFNETTGDLVYSDQATYAGEGYTSLGEQTNMNPRHSSGWVFDSQRSKIATMSKDPAIAEKIFGLKSMIQMFSGCSGLTSFDLSGFDTSQVVDVNNMFSGCSGLTSLDLSGFDTSQITGMFAMFYGCTGLKSLDLSSFDTSKVTAMASMFKKCSGLTSLKLSSFDTSQVTSMNGMFQDCSSLTSLDLSGFDTSKVVNMGSMFQGCSSLTSLDLSGFDTSKVSSLSTAFNSVSLNKVRCRPAQFISKIPDFIIPSSTGKWYNYKGDEVTDFSSDVPTTLYADPSMAPDGSKLVNLQDLKAALESKGNGLPLAFGDVLYQGTENEPGMIVAMNNAGVPELGIADSNVVDDVDYVMSISPSFGIHISSMKDETLIAFGDIGTGFPGIFVKPDKDSVASIIDPAIDPYGFAYYATDQDFENYVFQVE